LHVQPSDPRHARILCGFQTGIIAAAAAVAIVVCVVGNSTIFSRPRRNGV